MGLLRVRAPRLVTLLKFIYTNNYTEIHVYLNVNINNGAYIFHCTFKAFLESAGKDNKDVQGNIIGQFGVGFYSVFMVSLFRFCF